MYCSRARVYAPFDYSATMLVLLGEKQLYGIDDGIIDPEVTGHDDAATVPGSALPGRSFYYSHDRSRGDP